MIYYLKVSAKSEKNLVDMIHTIINKLRVIDGGNEELYLFCAALNASKEDFKHRLVIRYENKTELISSLTDYIESKYNKKVFYGSVSGQKKVCFIFSGQGSQYSQMGMVLYKEHKVFREAILKCAVITDEILDVPLLSVLFDENGLIHNTLYAQPCLFAVQYACAQVLLQKIDSPSLVIGHSIGEYVGLCLAGVVELEEILPIICLRSKLMASVKQKGSMVSVKASQTQLNSINEQFETLQIAAINGIDSVVYSGENEGIVQLCTYLSKQQITFKKLNTSNAFHSHLMKSILPEFEAACQKLSYHKPRFPVIDNITGQVINNDSYFTAEYLTQHIISPVCFYQSCQQAYNQGANVFIEIGPSAVLSLVSRAVSEISGNNKVIYISTNVKGHNESETTFKAISQYYCQVGSYYHKKYHHKEDCLEVLLSYPFDENTFCPPLENTTLSKMSIKSAQKNNTAAYSLMSVTQHLPLPLMEIITDISMNSSVNGNMSLSLDLGFDSILITQLATELSKYTSIPLQDLLNSIYQADSIDDLQIQLSEHIALPLNTADKPEQDWEVTVKKEDAHKHFEENLLLDKIRQISPSEFELLVCQKNTHSFFYEHAKDHVPGLYLIEAARQAPVVICHHYLDVDFEKPFVLNDLNITFYQFADIVKPLTMTVNIETKSEKASDKKTYYSQMHIYQGLNLIAKFSSHFMVYQKDKYQSLHKNKELNNVT